jgi:hypothetical protein
MKTLLGILAFVLVLLFMPEILHAVSWDGLLFAAIALTPGVVFLLIEAWEKKHPWWQSTDILEPWYWSNDQIHGTQEHGDGKASKNTRER